MSNETPTPNAAQALGIVIAVLVLLALAVAMSSAIVFASIDYVGGHDLSFRECLGGGLLLMAASGSGVSAKPA